MRLVTVTKIVVGLISGHVTFAKVRNRDAPSSSLDPKANAVVDAIVVRGLSERFGTC